MNLSIIKWAHLHGLQQINDVPTNLHFIIQSRSQLSFIIFLLFHAFNAFTNTTPHFLKDSNASLKVKTMEEEVGVHSLAHNILKVKGACWSFGMRTIMNDKRVNYSHKLTQTKQQVG